jgi:hypothetical protein
MRRKARVGVIYKKVIFLIKNIDILSQLALYRCKERMIRKEDKNGCNKNGAKIEFG